MTVAINVRLQSVLDLSVAGIRRKLHVSLESLLSEDWQSIQNAGHEARTQAIGRLALEAGIEGILVNSAADRKGHNLVVFPDALKCGSSLELINSQDLPRPPAY